MAWSSFPVFPTDDGWPYPDLPGGFDDPAADDEVDLDALELRVDPHAFECLDPTEYELVTRRFGFIGPATSMKDLATRVRLVARPDAGRARRRHRQAPDPPHHRLLLTRGQHSLQRPRPARLASSSSRSIVRAWA